MGLNDSKQLVVGRRRRWGGVRHHLAPPLMDLELLEEVPLSQPDHGTCRSLSAGRLLPPCSRLWWAMLWGGCPSSPRGHCLWAQPGVTPYFSPPLAEGPGHAPSHARGEGGSRIPPQQVKSRVLFWGQPQLGPCGPRLALVRPSIRRTALPSRQPSPCTLCPSVSASLCGGLPTSAASSCALCLPLQHSDPSRAWKGVGAHELGGGPAAHSRGCCMVFFLSLC